MSNSELKKDLEAIEKEVSDFERDLRTSFRKENPNNHIVIQRVNVACEQIKTKIKKLLETPTTRTSENFKISSVASRAIFYTSKFDQAKEKWILLDWDILYKVWARKP